MDFDVEGAKAGAALEPKGKDVDSFFFDSKFVDSLLGTDNPTLSNTLPPDDSFAPSIF
jgi:hypothetical protein